MIISFDKIATASMVIDEDQHAAVILAYHKIEEPLYPETHLSLEQFTQQIEELTSEAYNVMALDEVIDAFEAGIKLPTNSVSITFDGPYRSSFDHAFPILIKKRMPFTIFISPQLMDSPRHNTVSWRELNALLEDYDFIDIGLHPLRYERITNLSKSEITKNLEQSINKIKENVTSFDPRAAIFSYPFGAYNQDYRDAVAALNLKAAVTHSSSVAYAGQDLYQLPRFAMTESYGELERFRRIINALPLPVTDWSPEVFTSTGEDGQYADKISFQISPSIPSLDLLRCFVSGQSAPHMVIGEAQNLVTLELSEPLSSGRTRVNCTIPGPASNNVLSPSAYRWHGVLYSLE